MDEAAFFSLANKKYNVSRGTFEKLKIYRDLLFKWQQAINLVSRGTLDDFWQRHVLDSLQITEYIKGNKVLDIGSGGGFPGMVLAICGNLDITCVDSDNRKIIFLKEVSRLTSASVRFETDRIENFENKNFDTVCSRGFATLCRLIELTKKHSLSEYGIFLKGAKYKEEIALAEKYFTFHYKVFNSQTENSGKIIVISGSIYEKE